MKDPLKDTLEHLQELQTRLRDHRRHCLLCASRQATGPRRALGPCQESETLETQIAQAESLADSLQQTTDEGDSPTPGNRDDSRLDFIRCLNLLRGIAQMSDEWLQEADEMEQAGLSGSATLRECAQELRTRLPRSLLTG